MEQVLAPRRRAGRPRALSGEKALTAIALYRSGLGYRAIARELMIEGTLVSFSTVKRTIKRLQGPEPKRSASITL